MLNTYREAEWYMIADDDTFIVPKGLKRMLERHDSSKPLYLGRTMFSPPREEGAEAAGEGADRVQEDGKEKEKEMVPFAHGGSGVVISRALAEAFLPHLSQALEDHSCEYSGYGDADLGYCIKKYASVSVTHEACLHSEIPEAYAGVQDLFVKMSDLEHPCTFHYAFRGSKDDKNSADVNLMPDWQKRYNSEEEATEEV
jgi:hypothetical protein